MTDLSEQCGERYPYDSCAVCSTSMSAAPVRCPGVPPGPYAQVDIGAGTTNAAVVSIWERNFTKRWIKDSLGFYGAQSVERLTPERRVLFCAGLVRES